MPETLRGVGAVVEHDGRVYNIAPGEIPESTPKAVIDTLRRRGALVDMETTETPAAAASESATQLPAGAPDVAGSDVASLAVFIDENNLTAPQTVALAGDSPENARKVLEAEQLASGGDGRATVVKPLTKIIEGA